MRGTRFGGRWLGGGLAAANVPLAFYDATYLESAIRNRLPLGSFDQPLCKAAKACGIRLTPEK